MKFDLGLWANSGDQIQNRTLHRTKRETQLTLYCIRNKVTVTTLLNYAVQRPVRTTMVEHNLIIVQKPQN